MCKIYQCTFEVKELTYWKVIITWHWASPKVLGSPSFNGDLTTATRDTVQSLTSRKNDQWKVRNPYSPRPKLFTFLWVLTSTQAPRLDLIRPCAPPPHHSTPTPSKTVPSTSWYMAWFSSRLCYYLHDFVSHRPNKSDTSLFLDNITC